MSQLPFGCTEYKTELGASGSRAVKPLFPLQIFRNKVVIIEALFFLITVTGTFLNRVSSCAKKQIGGFWFGFAFFSKTFYEIGSPQTLFCLCCLKQTYLETNQALSFTLT